MESGNASCFDDEFMAEILGEFLDESQGYLADLNDNLLVLDELVGALDDTSTAQVDLDLLNTMFRAAHSIKGLSAMLQLDDINRLTHHIENVFDAARNDNLSIQREVVDLMFQAFDRLTGMVNQLSEPNGEELQCDEIIRDIQNLLDDIGVADSQTDAHQPSAGSQDSSEAVTQDTDKSQEESKNASGNARETTDNTTPVPTEKPPAPPEDPFADVVDEIDPTDKYLSMFLDESESSLDTLTELMLTEDQELLIDRALVICHQIKGAAATVRLNRVAKLSHLMEDLLQRLRDGDHSITTEVVDAVVFTVDSLRTHLQMVQNNTQGPDTFLEASQKLQEVHTSVFPSGLPSGVPAEAAPVGQQAVQALDHLIDSDRLRVAEAAPPRQSALIGLVAFEEKLPLVELKAKLVIERLTALGDLFHCEPDEHQLDDPMEITRLLFGLASDCPPDFIRRQIDLEGITKIELEAVVPPHTDKSPSAEVTGKTQEPASQETASQEPANRETANREPKTGEAAPSAEEPAATDDRTARESKKAAEASRPQSKPAETIRVDIDRLDQLMNLAGQLVINKARFGQIGSKLKGLAKNRQGSVSLTNIEGVLGRILTDANELNQQSFGKDVYVQSLHCYAEQIRADLEVVRSDMTQMFEARNLLNDLSEAVHQLDRVSDGIQKSVMDTRMVPIGPLFGRFKRVIRDITRVNGKDVQLVIRGENTELDKRMIDELGDPLIHMVRNSADHGIESPEEREKAGKPRQGTVTLNAYHRGNRILIQVRDDGKGLLPEKIREKAIAKGILSAQDAERLTPQQTYQLIWEPGFSTAEQVTEVSGRGMGMDIVRSKIEQINGTVELESEVGVGTTITIKLPLTMAILPSLLTVVGGNVFAVPVESVVEIVRFKRTELVTVHGCKAARVRGRVISVVGLADVLEWNQEPPHVETVSDEITLVIIGMDGNELALSVDDLLGEEDIVIKSLADNYRNVSGIAGASILGDGRVSLILDVSALLELVCSRKPESDSEAATASFSPSGN